jgi:cytochrome bd-type quinol oxidase subunit 2
MTRFLHPYQALCLFVRLLIGLAAFCVSNGVIVAKNLVALKILAVLLLIPAVVMASLWIFGIRQYAKESLDVDNRTWWNSLRPVHAMLLALFSVLALFSHVPQHAYVALIADVGVGLGAFVERNRQR